ncbi:FAD-dependent monooxygenase [Geodermatophilus sp. SYSU D00742]
MNVVCVGGGPAGLFFAICARRRDPDLAVRVVERYTPGATSGWGVTYSERMMDLLFANDPPGAREVHARSVSWDEQEWWKSGRSAYLPHYRSALERSALIDVLSRRAVELGAEVEFGREVRDLAEVADADLVVASDGVGSRVRRQLGDVFGTTTTYGRNRYLWLGTDHVFERITFAFERTAAGWVWLHAYPSSRTTSTCVVECSPETWQGLGLDTLPGPDGLALLSEIFAEVLHGRPLAGRTSDDPGTWQCFPHTTNRIWWHDNVALMGDAAHASHFTWASGTRLAMTDAAALADALAGHRDLTQALTVYDERRRRRANRAVDAARQRAERWEHFDELLDLDVLDFVHAKSNRRNEATLRRLRPLHRAGQLGVVRAAGREFRAVRRRFDARRRWPGLDGEPTAVPDQPRSSSSRL